MIKTYQKVLIKNKGKSVDILKHILEIIGKDGYIAGSFSAAMCFSHLEAIEWDDVDVFSKNPFAYENLLKKLKNIDIRNVKETDNSIYYIFNNGDIHYKLNLIKPVARSERKLCGPPERVVNDFDFYNIMCYIDNKKYVYVYDRKEFLDLHNKKFLKINKIQCPVRIFRRISKYLRKGFILTIGDVLKLNKKIYEVLSKEGNYEKLIKLMEESELSNVLGTLKIENSDYEDILGGKFFS